MIRAILDDRKTVTRRLDARLADFDGDFDEGGPLVPWKGSGCLVNVKSRYGAVGDTLWVREAHAVMCREADPFCWCCPPCPAPGEYHYVEYRADTNAPRPGGWDAVLDESDKEEAPKWTPSIHMPRWASRISLTVEDTRVERLQDITEEDAKAEGVEPFPKDPEGDCWADGTHRTAFEYLWGKLNGFDGEPKARGTWKSNPWVWRVQFLRLEIS